MLNSFKLYISIVMAMIFWSFSFIWTQKAIESFPPMTLITLRLIIASLILYFFTKLTGKFQKIQRKDIKLFLLLAFFEPYLYYVGETFGLTLVNSTLASVIVSTIPLFAPVLAFILLRERIAFLNVLGILVSLIGVFFVVYQPSEGIAANPWGVALLFLAVFAAICYATTLRKISTNYSTFSIIFYQSLFGLVFFLPTFCISDLPDISKIHISSDSLVALGMLSVFASVVAFVLFASAVRQVGVNRTNVFVNLIPVFTAIFSWLIMGELISSTKWLGISIVVLGLFVSQSGKLNLKRIKADKLN